MPVVSFARLLNKESVETIVIIVPEALDLPTIQIIHNSPRSYTIYWIYSRAGVFIYYL